MSHDDSRPTTQSKATHVPHMALSQRLRASERQRFRFQRTDRVATLSQQTSIPPSNCRQSKVRQSTACKLNGGAAPRVGKNTPG